MKLLIKQLLRESLKENSFGDDFNLPEIPKEIYDFIENEYWHMDFDWNKMQRKLGDKMSEWLTKHTKESIYNNLDDIINQINDDINTLEARKLSDVKLYAFEELIKPSLDKGVLTPALNDFQASVLMDPYVSPDEIKKALNDKSVLGPDGNIDTSKTTYSDYFKGGGINYPAFERYVEQHPEFKKVFKDWLKLFKENTKLHTKDLKGFRGVTPLEKLIKIRDILVNFNKVKHMGDASLNEFDVKKALATGMMALGTMGAAKAQTAPSTPAPTTQTTPAPEVKKTKYGSTPEQREAAAEKRKQNRQKIFDNFVKGAFNKKECLKVINDEEYADGCKNTDNDGSPYINGTSSELPEVIYRELQDGTKLKISLKKYQKIIKNSSKQDDAPVDGLMDPSFKATSCGISKAAAKQDKKDFKDK
jgi:hypothetical protein